MDRGLRWAAAAAVMLATMGGPARAQYFYPPGYGGYGWRGWGVGGGFGGSTVYGDAARGMGAFAAGAGVYDQKTAAANAINANTAMRWNEYLWQCQLVESKRYHEKLARDRAAVTKTADAVYKRLRDAPTASDITRGDALNVALDELTAPSVYSKPLKGAKAPLAGSKIREIPFQYAAAALIASVDDLTQNGPPEILKAPEFEADRAALRELRAEFRKQAEAQEPVDPAIIKKAQARIKAMGRTLKDNAPKFNDGSNKGRLAYREAENYLKGLYGLVTMLETPAIDVLLAGVDKRPDTTLGDLLSFMNAFNLRFGPATTPEQRLVYGELYSKLDALRDEIVAAGPAKAGRPGKPAPVEFFSGMDYSDLDAKPSRPTLPPTAPKP